MGKTALFDACMMGYDETVKLLLEGGANPLLPREVSGFSTIKIA
jgi:ankyrin repeat protein